MSKSPRFVFYGTPDRAIYALDELAKHGLVPSLIVTQPDRPQGRSLALTPPPAKVWGLSHNVRVIQPEKLDNVFKDELKRGEYDVAIVVAYGKILNKDVLTIPKHGSINLHPSLLPRLRGASPVETTILADERSTGVSVILMDEEVDHGPIIAKKEVSLPSWPICADDLAKILIREGAKIIAEVLPDFLAGKITPTEQDHANATYTQKIKKEDGLIDISADGWKNYLKWNAYHGWPGVYFFIEKSGKKIRVVAKDCVYENGNFIIRKVVPEGKKEMSWTEFNSWKNGS